MRTQPAKSEGTPAVAVQGVVRWIATKIQIAWHRYRADRNNYWMMRDYWQGLKFCSDYRRERRDFHVAQIERLTLELPGASPGSLHPVAGHHVNKNKI